MGVEDSGTLYPLCAAEARDVRAGFGAHDDLSGRANVAVGCLLERDREMDNTVTVGVQTS